MARTRSRRTSSGSRSRKAAARGGRRWVLGTIVAGALALAAVVVWQRLGRTPPPSVTGPIGLAADEANRIGLRLAGGGDHLGALPYFREVVRQDPTSSYAHQNLASGLGNGAQQARAHLGRVDNAVRASVERIAMMKESIAETQLAERFAANDQERAQALFERGRALETWGFPIDALGFYRGAAGIAPGRADVRGSILRIEHDLATGGR